MEVLQQFGLHFALFSCFAIYPFRPLFVQGVRQECRHMSDQSVQNLTSKLNSIPEFNDAFLLWCGHILHNLEFWLTFWEAFIQKFSWTLSAHITHGALLVTAAQIHTNSTPRRGSRFRFFYVVHWTSKFGIL